MADWFKGWFDSKYYHILYKNRDNKEAQRFIDNLSSYLQINKEQRVLDLACGKGRHSVYLNSKGYDVTGVDLSEQSIQYAKQFENNRLRFGVHDMREVYGEEPFDIILNLFTSFGYFEDEAEQYKTINSIESMLRKQGVLVIDFMNAQKVITNLVASEVKKVDGVNFHISRNVKNGFIIKDISFEDQGEKFCFQERVKVLMREDFESYVKNWEIVNVFGDYDLNPFHSDSSDRLILIAKKIRN